MKEEEDEDDDDDDLSLPGQDDEMETDGQTHCCTGSMMHITGREHGLDNGDTTGINGQQINYF